MHGVPSSLGPQRQIPGAICQMPYVLCTSCVCESVEQKLTVWIYSKIAHLEAGDKAQRLRHGLAPCVAVASPDSHKAFFLSDVRHVLSVTCLMNNQRAEGVSGVKWNIAAHHGINIVSQCIICVPHLQLVTENDLLWVDFFFKSPCILSTITDTLHTAVTSSVCASYDSE